MQQAGFPKINWQSKSIQVQNWTTKTCQSNSLHTLIIRVHQYKQPINIHPLTNHQPQQAEVLGISGHFGWPLSVQTPKHQLASCHLSLDDWKLVKLLFANKTINRNINDGGQGVAQDHSICLLAQTVRALESKVGKQFAARNLQDSSWFIYRVDASWILLWMFLTWTMKSESHLSLTAIFGHVPTYPSSGSETKSRAVHLLMRAKISVVLLFEDLFWDPQSHYMQLHGAFTKQLNFPKGWQ